MINATDYAAGLLAAVVVLQLVRVFKKRSLGMSSKNGISLPPGPPPRWFWSSAMPTVNTARVLTDYVRTYGPLVSFRQGSKVIIIIGSSEAATAIMEREGGSLVDRPPSIVADLFSGGMRVVTSSGGLFRRLRKAVHTHLQPKVAQEYRGVQSENAKEYILDILNDPKNHKKHASRFSASVILRVTYGKSTPTALEDPEVVRITEIMHRFDIAMRPGAYLVDRVPLLRYLPGYGKQLTEWFQEELSLYKEQLVRVKSDMEQHKARHSFTKTLLENTESHGLTIDEMSFVGGSLFGAGSDTSAVGITNMILAAAAHPLAQAKVHEELDMIVGLDRAPTFEDSSSLPQVRAFMLETMRWRPVVPIGFPHFATKDIFWQGYWIPKGATVFGCHWALARDPITFPDPETFNPQRWINSEGQLRDDMKAFTFGFGRRVCPGQHLAMQSLYISFVLLLWSFRVAQRPDAPIDVTAYTDSMVSQAAPFEVDFIPRVDVAKLKELLTMN